MQPLKLVLVAWQALLVALPAVLFVGGYEPANLENRARAVLPPLAWSSLADATYFADLARYLSDRLPTRALAIRADSAIDLRAFADSPVRSVLKGRDGWYYARESVIRECLTRAEHAEFAAEPIRRVAEFLAARDIQLVVTIVPDKRSIYPEHLGPVGRLGSVCANETRDHMRRVMPGTGDIYLDVYGVFERHRAKRDDISLYSPLDTHWTTYGSGLFAGRIVAMTETWTLDDASLELAGTDTGGRELSRMMAVDLPDTRGGRYIWTRPGVREGDNHAIPHGAPGEAYRLFGGVAEGSARLSTKKVVVIHDSFIYYAWDHLARFFETALYVHWDVVHNPEVAGFIADADILIVESVERFAFDRFIDFFSDDTIAKVGDAAGHGEWERILATARQ
jgi:hypothetical protein